MRQLPKVSTRNDFRCAMPEVNRIIRDICAAIGEPELLTNGPFAEGDRRQHVVRARRIVYWVLRKVTKASLPRLGIWANKDHSTVAHAIQALWAEAAGRRELRDEMARILRSVYRAHQARRRGEAGASVPTFHRKRRRPRPTNKLAAGEIDHNVKMTSESEQSWYDHHAHGTDYDFFTRQNKRAVEHMRKALAQEAKERT